ncbi:ribosomal protein S1 [Embleya sp. AB8]
MPTRADSGTVTKLVPFGAFVRVADGVEGLVHIVELADREVESPEQVVREGDEVLVRILDNDLVRRRVALSMKRAADRPDPPVPPPAGDAQPR